MFKLNSLMSDGFSWHAALSLAVASKVAYDPPAAVRRATQEWGFETSVVIEAGRTQGFIAESRDVVLVVFRGTDSVADWLGNLKLTWTRRPYGRLHSGFLDAFEPASKLVAAALEAAAGSGRRAWITGHSLGGALAAITAAEFADRATITGVHTFGQPRLADMAMAAEVAKRYGQRFHRFVNNDDLVTRLPFGFEHVGRAIHFDAAGNLDRRSVATELARQTPPPLSLAEFEALQRDIKAVQAGLRTSGIEVSDEAERLAIEGLWPDLIDHRIARYVAVLSQFVARSEEKVDPAVVMLSESRKAQRMRSGEREWATIELAADREMIPALVRLRTEAWAPPPGVKVNSRSGTFASIQAQKAVLLNLKDDDNVKYVQASRNHGIEELSVSVPFVKATAVHRPPMGERGAHAFVGLIDTGIDVLHEAFRGSDGRTRIAAIWDQKDATGPTPQKFDPARFTQDYGTVYTSSDIDGFIAARATPRTALRDPHLHGTHVASIAAGRAVGTLADGLAPEAGIIAVIPDWRFEPDNPASLGYSNSHVDALHFIKTAAEGANKLVAKGRPIAVNVSLGMNAGAHDGTSILEEMFDSLCGNGRDPGFVVVKSAGNERGNNGHKRVGSFQGRQTIEWQSLDVDRPEDYVEVWYDGLDSNEFTLEAPNGDQTPVLSVANRDIRKNLGGNACRMHLTRLHPDNGDNRVVITISPGREAIQIGTWKLHIDGVSVRSTGSHLHLWVERAQDVAVRVLDPTDDVTLSIPGTARSVISVAACESTLPLRLYKASSFGLTRDRRAKPDICAPGANIVAARANTLDLTATISFPGTSMAAPHVTGAIALVMSHREANGLSQYNAHQFRSALIQTATGLSGQHHEGFGFGMLDAEALFRFLK